MDVVHERCAGLDVHKDEVVACLRVGTGGRVERVRERFRTTTRGFLALADWLAVHRCCVVALEATGVYWKPVWHILESVVVEESKPSHRRGAESLHRRIHGNRDFHPLTKPVHGELQNAQGFSNSPCTGSGA